MVPEVRIDAQGMPDEEYRKLPYLLKWVLTDKVGVPRMAEQGEPVDILLVDTDKADKDQKPAAAAGAQEIPVTQEPSRLANPEAGLTYPIRVADLQSCLQRAVAATSRPLANPAATPEESNGTEKAAPANPDPGPAAANVDQLVAPLLDPQPGSDLRLVTSSRLDVVVRADRGFRSPLSPRDWGWLHPDLSGAYWEPVGQSEDDEAADWQPLTRLVWLLAYYGARDGLLPRIPQDRSFALAGWPDYSIIPMEANNLKVWAYLKGNTADAETIAEATGVDRGQVLGSLNAGYLCGQVQLSQDAADAAHREGERSARSGILGKIRQRLGLQSTHPQETAT